jgi:hypothetical protein
MVTGLVAAGLLVAACVLGWSQLHRRPAAAAPQATARSDAGLARSDAGRLAVGESVTDAEAGGSGGDQAGIRTAADAARVLAQLAAVRERAYAQRRPELLAGVYSSAPLLAADTRQLYRSVPAGCGLSGVRTSYQGLSLGSGAGTRSVQLSATASLPSAVLSCQGAVRGRTEPTGPLRLRLVLADAGRGWRIVSERAG